MKSVNPSRSLLICLCVMRMASTARAEVDSKKFAVMPFAIAVGLQSKDTARLLDELLLTELSQRALGGQKFLGSADITAVLGLEQQKAMIGCDDDSCLAEIGNALGVERMITPALGKLGDKFAINFKVIDPVKVTVVRRGSFVVPADEGALPAAMSQLADRILGQAPAKVNAQAAATKTQVNEGALLTDEATGEVDDESQGSGVLGVAGLVLAVTGVAVLAGSGVVIGLSDLTLADSASSGTDKQGALNGYAGGLAGVGAGLLVTGLGATLVVLGL